MPVHSDLKSHVTANLLLSIAVVLCTPQAATADEPATNPAAYQEAQQKLVKEIQRINDKLVTPQMDNRMVKINRDFLKILANGIQGQAQAQVLDDGIKHMVYDLTDVDKTPQEMARDYGTIVSRLGRAGSSILNNNARKRFREKVCRAVLTHTQPLLTNNFNARSQALELLLDLEVVQPRGGVRIEMDEKVHETYVSILTDPEQPDAVKSRAANCARKYLVKADAIPQYEMALAEALAAELRRPETEIAYQDTLIAALERVNAARQLVAPGRPVHLCVAVEVMQDRRRDILIRSRCARVLGRCGFDNPVNFEPLAWAVAELTLEVAFRNTQSKDRMNPKWQRSGWYLYTAFHHENRKESNKGFLNRDNRSTVISGAYEACVPVMAHLMFNDSAPPARMLGSIDTWLKKNAPRDKNFDRTCPPIKAGGQGG